MNVVSMLFPGLPFPGHDATAMTRAEVKNDRNMDLLALRSLLFLPASNPRAIAKARELNTDLVVLDLEDAVRSDDKAEARKAAVEAVAAEWDKPVAIRINGVGTQWHSLDLDAAARSRADLVVVPRAISGHLVHGISEAVSKPVLAMIETAAGVLAAPAIAQTCAGLIAARAAGIAAFDGVFNSLEDTDGFLREAEEGRRLGFDGKSLIHPNQIEPCHRAFAPSAAEVERAKALVEAFHGGAERFGNEMIERMHVEAAQRLLERAGA
jgi:citrate lyase subunit beta/citryl-CoA lyase